MDPYWPYGSDEHRWFSGFPPPPQEPDTVLTECMHCTSMIETRTGEEGIRDAIYQGWSIDACDDLICPGCTKEREEMIGDET